MIIRVWRAEVNPGTEQEFWDFIQNNAVPLMHRARGLMALHVGNVFGGGSEFVMVSAWKDMESMRAFTGESWRDAVILPGEEKFLVKTFVDHYEDAIKPL